MKHAWLAPVMLVAVPYAQYLNGQNKQIENLAPFAVTPDLVVDRMLQLGELKAGEKMFDLGSGDGRIVIQAARKYKAEATGVEYDPRLVKLSISRIRGFRLTGLARIIEGDLLQQDYSSADLITVYLLPVANEKLIPIFERQLKPGARVVSNNTPLTPWEAVKMEAIKDDGEGHSHKIYLYVKR
jgi:SAM-dependent methyltransferase